MTSKSVSKTFRIPEHLIKILEKDAEAQRISLNAFTSSILARYAEWERFVNKIGFVSFSRDSFRWILNEMDDEKIVKFAQERAARFPREFSLFLFKRSTVETYLESIKLLSKYSGLADFEIETEGRDHIVRARHQLGRKWSLWLESFIREGMKQNFGVNPQVEVGEGSLVLRFRS